MCSRAEAAAAARAYSGFFFPILIDGAGKPKGGACSGRGGPADTAARPPARLLARNSRLRPRLHWLRRAAAAARTGRPACQSAAKGAGGAPCRGGFLFARACARNNERDPPRARGLHRAGPARRPRCGEVAPPPPRLADAARGAWRLARVAGVSAAAGTAAWRQRFLPPTPAGAMPLPRCPCAPGVGGDRPGGGVPGGWRQLRRPRAAAAAAFCSAGAKMSARWPQGSQPARVGPAWWQPCPTAGSWSPQGKPPSPVSPGVPVRARQPRLGGRPRGPLHKGFGRRRLAPG